MNMNIFKMIHEKVLHTLLEKPTVEHTLSRFYGNYDIVFDWDESITS